MSDEDLRSLERAATDATSRIRYAEALLRLDRKLDAIAALLPSLEDEEVRRRIGRIEAPHVPLHAAPRVLWRTPIGARFAGSFYASALGVVGFGRELSDAALGLPLPLSPRPATTRAPTWTTWIVDAATGTLRRTFEALHGSVLGVFGHVLLLHESGRLAAMDLVTGERVWELAIEATHVGVGLRGLRIGHRGRVRELAWPDASAPPTETWPAGDVSPPVAGVHGGPIYTAARVIYSVGSFAGGMVTDPPDTSTEVVARATDADEDLWRMDLPSVVYAVAPERNVLYVLTATDLLCLV